ncbi:MAG: WGR domain-containing protein [Candidatus Thiodiazotropha endolucinida]
MNRLWINTNNRRYYRVHLQRDLLGDWTLTRSWGSLDSHHGQVRSEVVTDEHRGIQIMHDISRRRATRGYTEPLTVQYGNMPL